MSCVLTVIRGPPLPTGPPPFPKFDNLHRRFFKALSAYQLQSLKSHIILLAQCLPTWAKTWELHPNAVDKIFYFHDYFSAFFFFCLQAKVGIHVKRMFSSWGLQYRELYIPGDSWDSRQIIMVILEAAVLSLPQLGRLSHCKYWSNMFCKLYVGNNRDPVKWGKRETLQNVAFNIIFFLFIKQNKLKL